MDIGTAKCSNVAVSRGQLVDTGNVPLPSGDSIQQLEVGEAYKYLRILEADSLKHQQMKSNLTKEYKKNVSESCSTVN